MQNWYELDDEKIVEIESSIDWFSSNNKKLINYLTESWYLTGTHKLGFAVHPINEIKWLERCYGIEPEKKLPEEVLVRLKNDLQPFIISI